MLFSLTWRAETCSRDVRVTHPNGRLSSALIGRHLTNGALSWWQRTEYRWGSCLGQNWLPGAGWGCW